MMVATGYAIAVMVLRLLSVTSFPGSNFMHMPKPQLVCVPSPSKRGCSEVELINLHPIPEEKRVLFMFTTPLNSKAPPVLRYEPTEHWQCYFGEGVSTPIRCVHPRTVSAEWSASNDVDKYSDYNHLSLAQCELPPSALGPLLNDEALDIAVTLGTKGLVKYSLRIQRWNRKKILGMCLR